MYTMKIVGSGLIFGEVNTTASKQILYFHYTANSFKREESE
jgi:hypothetical protein